MKIKFLTIFVIVILGLSVAPLSFAATKSKVSSASKKTIQTVKKPVPTKKKVSLKATKIRYKQGLIINAPLINPKYPPGGPR